MSSLGFLQPKVPGYSWGKGADGRPRLWLDTGLVRCGPNGEPCYDHGFWDGSGIVVWESTLHPESYPKGWPVSPHPQRLRGVVADIPLPAPTVVVARKTNLVAESWSDAECSLPTLRGFALFAALGWLGAGRRRKLRGVMDGIFGGWIGCAAAKAIGARSDLVSAAMTLGGAWFVAKTFDGK